MSLRCSQTYRCSIILAGGEGKRLQSFIQQLLGYTLPKQYVTLWGSRSMLEHTIARAEQLVPSSRIFTVVARNHLQYPEVRRQTDALPPQNPALQPLNRETGPGLLLPLMHLYRRYPGSTVAVFPSDHFILNEDLFLKQVERAFEAVEKVPSQIIFLGVKPTNPEKEYGYIVPQRDASISTIPSVYKVQTFIEKPDLPVAARAISQGAVWNTMVMVFKPEILLSIVCRTTKALYRSFLKIFQALSTPQEALTIENEYNRMQSVNLSKDIIESLTGMSRNRLSVIPMEDIFWSDLGTKERVLSAMDPARLNFSEKYETETYTLFSESHNELNTQNHLKPAFPNFRSKTA